MSVEQRENRVGSKAKTFLVNLAQISKPAVAGIVLAVGFLDASGAASQQSDAPPSEVATQMLALRDADPAQAAQLADTIRRQWDQSGSATADYLLRRARNALELGAFQTALEHLTALVDHAPQFAQGWAERARIYAALDLFGPAVGDLEHALALNPDHFDAIMGLATLLESMNKPQDAYQAYLQVEAIHPNLAGLTEAMSRLAPMVRGQDL